MNQYFDHEKYLKQDAYHDLIRAGMVHFGEYGFNGTSIRKLCQEANTNISNIKYHFEHKVGLYRAVLAYISFRFKAMTRPKDFDLKEISQDEAKHMLVEVLFSFAQLPLIETEARLWHKVISREHASPSEHFDIIYENIISPKHKHICRLVEIITGKSATSSYVRIKTHMLIGQALIFLTGTEVILRELKVSEFNQAKRNIVKQIFQEEINNLTNKQDSTQ